MWYNLIVTKNHTKQKQEEFFMTDYSTKIAVTKRAIFHFTEKISEGMKRPFHKFAADMCYGVLASESCVISDIAQALQEDTQKINTIERLTRHLGAEIPETVQDNYRNTIQKYLPDDIVIHLDNSDVIKPSGRAFEGISRVRDGSRSTPTKSVMGNGYYVTEATAMTKSMHPVSMFSEVWSAESAEYTSGGEFAYTRKAVTECTEKFGHATFVMDRGYDSNSVFQLLENLGQNYVIRLKLNRKVRVGSKKYSINDLCSKYKGKYKTKVVYHGRVRKARMTVIKGCLSGSDRLLSIILIFGLSDHPMALATNLNTDTKNHLISAMRLYFSRWRIEEYFRCKKQSFSFENFRVRSLTAIHSLNFFLSACMLFLAILRETSAKNSLFLCCIDAAAPLKPKVYFFYYRLLQGLYLILSKARTGIRAFFRPIRPNQAQLKIRGFA